MKRQCQKRSCETRLLWARKGKKESAVAESPQGRSGAFLSKLKLGTWCGRENGRPPSLGLSFLVRVGNRDRDLGVRAVAVPPNPDKLARERNTLLNFDGMNEFDSSSS